MYTFKGGSMTKENAKVDLGPGVVKFIEQEMQKARKDNKPFILHFSEIPIPKELKPSEIENAIIEIISKAHVEQAKHPGQLYKEFELNKLIRSSANIPLNLSKSVSFDPIKHLFGGQTIKLDSKWMTTTDKKPEPGKKQKTKKVKKVKVTFRHEIFQGAKYYRCESIEGIKQNLELPDKYTMGDYYYYVVSNNRLGGPNVKYKVLLHSDKDHLCPSGCDCLYLVPGELYSKECLDWILNVMRKGSGRLRSINRELKNLKKNWEGYTEVIEL